MTEIDVTWEVEDGYGGPARPQNSTICIEDFAGLDRDEIEKQLAEFLDAELRDTISWCADVGQIVEKIEGLLSERD